MSFTLQEVKDNDAKILCPLAKYGSRNTFGLRSCRYRFVDSLYLTLIAMSMRSDHYHSTDENNALKSLSFNYAYSNLNLCDFGQSATIEDEVVYTTDCCDNYYVHNQTEPATLWVVEHNLGKRCDTTIVNDAGQEIDADVIYINDNLIHIEFLIPMTGKVYCN